jgi:hypothetical protein
LAEEVRQTALRITLAHLRESERTGILEIPLAQAAKLALAAGAQKDRREYALSESELRRIYAPQTLEAPPGLATMNDEELWQLRTLQDKAQGR